MGNEYLTWIKSAQWREKSKMIQKVSGNYCVLFPCLKSRHCHHLTYRNMTKEKVFRDCVPLSITAHKLVHLKIFWKSPLRIPVNYLLRLLLILSLGLKLFRS
jgi:hypothetical protein